MGAEGEVALSFLATSPSAFRCTMPPDGKCQGGKGGDFAVRQNTTRTLTLAKPSGLLRVCDIPSESPR